MPYVVVVHSPLRVHLLETTTHWMRGELCEVETSQEDEVSLIIIRTEIGSGWKVD